MIVHITKHQLETDLMVSDKPAIAEKKGELFSKCFINYKTLSILNLEKVATSNLKDLLKMDQNTIAKIVHLHHSIIIDELWLKITDCYFS